MLKANEVEPTYDDFYDKVRESIADMRRQTNAMLLANYPDREFLSSQARQLCEQLGSDGAQVNILMGGEQVTIVFVPDKTPLEDIRVPDTDSLCVLAVGAGKTVAIDDIKNDPFTAGHPAIDEWGSWASSPVQINGFSAGAICALDAEPREWTEEDEELLQSTAQVIGDSVETWANESMV